MDTEDSTLIDRFRQGDVAAFEVLVKRYQRPLFTFLIRLAGNQETAEDLFQETFIKVLRALPSYEERGKFGNWLFGIAHRVAVDFERQDRAWREQVIKDEKAVDTAADPRCLLDEAVERSELVEKVESTLTALPEKQRRVFLLRQHGELSFKEIARLMGEPLNTVLSHMHYAVTKLRRMLENNPGSADDLG